MLLREKTVNVSMETKGTSKRFLVSIKSPSKGVGRINKADICTDRAKNLTQNEKCKNHPTIKSEKKKMDCKKDTKKHVKLSGDRLISHYLGMGGRRGSII